MSEINFRIATDISDFQSGLTACTKSVDNLSTETINYEKESTKAFNKSTTEINDLNKEIIKGTKQVAEFEKETKKVGNSANAVKNLKQQIKEYTAEAFKAGAGTKAFSDNLAKAGALKDELADLNAQVKALSGNIGENLAKAAGSSLGLVARGFEGVSSVSILAGTNTKEFEKTLLQLQAFNGLANVAQEFSGIGDKIVEIKEGFRPVVDLFKSGASGIVDGYGTANESLKGFFSNFGSNAKDALKSGVSFVKDFGKNAGSVAKNIGAGFTSFFTNFGSNMKQFATSAKAGIATVGTAIKANPLGVILTVITLVIATFILLRDKIKPIAILFDAIGKEIDKITDGLEKLGQALGIVATQAEKNRNAVISGTEKAVSAIENQYDNEIKLASAAGKNTIDLEKEKARATVKRIAETLAAIQIKFQQDKKISEEDLKLFEELTQKRKQIAIDISAEIIKDEREKAAKKKEAEKKALDDAKAAAEKRKQLEKDLAQGLLDLKKKSEQAELSGLTGEAKLAKQRELSLQEVALLRDTLLKKGQLVSASFKFNEEQEEEFAKLKTQINEDYYNGILQLAIQTANKEAQINKSKVDGELANLELRNQIVVNNINAVRAVEGASEDEKLVVEEQRKKVLLEVEKQFTIDKLAIIIEQINAETAIRSSALNAELEIVSKKEDAVSKLRAEAIQNELNDINTNSALQIEAAQSAADNVIAGINESLQTKKPQKINIAKLLALDSTEISTDINAKFNVNVKPEDVEAAKEALSQLGSALSSILDTYFDTEQKKLDVELENNQKRIDSRNENIDNLQQSLAIEEEAAGKGLANNVDNLKAAIATQEAARQKDLENQKRIEEEKAKLAKQKLIVETIQQGSSLVTASANVFSTFSSIPIVGIPLAIGVITAMFGAFAAAKAQAFAATENKFAKGVIDLQGEGTGTSDSIDAKLSKGESVMTARETKENLSLFNGIRKKDSALIEIGIRNLLKNTGVSLGSDINENISEVQYKLQQSPNVTIVNNNKGLEDKNDALIIEIKKLQEITNKDSILSNGDRIIRKGSLTTIIKNRNNV